MHALPTTNITGPPAIQFYEKDEYFLGICYKLNLAMLSIANLTQNFNPLLKLQLFNNCFEIGIESLHKNFKIVTLAEVHEWKIIILSNLANENYNHFSHAVYLHNIVKFEIFCKNYAQAAGVISLALNVAKKFQESKNILHEIRYLKAKLYKEVGDK